MDLAPRRPSRTAFRSAATLLAPVVLALLTVGGIPLSGKTALETERGTGLTCPDPYAFCATAHGPDSTALAYCGYDACFDVNNGVESKIVAVDDGGDFPRRWLAMGLQDSVIDFSSCNMTVTPNAKLARIDIPDGRVTCRFEVTTITGTYHHHFVSYPGGACLAWVECSSPGESKH